MKLVLNIKYDFLNKMRFLFAYTQVNSVIPMDKVHE